MLFTSPRERRLWSAAGLCVALIYSSLYLARPIAEALRERNLLRLVVALAFLSVAVIVAWKLAVRRPGPRVIVTAALLGAGYFVLLGLVPMMPEERLHFLEYGVVAVLLYLALEERKSGGAKVASPLVLAAILTALAGWVDEGIQAVLPNRYYDLRDVAFNATAGILALASVKLVERAGTGE